MVHAAPYPAWQIDGTQFDPAAPQAGQLRFALRYAVLAPSNHNTQPWRFLIDGNTVQICADGLRALPVVDPFDRELLVAAGEGLTASCLNQPIEVSTLRAQISSLLHLDASPQLLLRVGRGPRAEHAPRRPLADVLF